MSLIQDKFASVFSQYDVTTQPRPDGGILLTLRNSEGKQVKRSISYQQLHTADQLTWVISAIRRDLAEQASELPQISLLQSQNRLDLPTYHSACVICAKKAATPLSVAAFFCAFNKAPVGLLHSSPARGW